jgi:hypothetical protein
MDNPGEPGVIDDQAVAAAATTARTRPATVRADAIGNRRRPELRTAAAARDHDVAHELEPLEQMARMNSEERRRLQ